MSKAAPRYWFPAKRYGWGWGFPCSPEGWAVTAGYVVAVLLAVFIINPERNLFVVLLTNRVNPTRQNLKIGGVRTALADAVVGAFPRPEAPRR